MEERRRGRVEGGGGSGGGGGRGGGGGGWKRGGGKRRGGGRVEVGGKMGTGVDPPRPSLPASPAGSPSALSPTPGCVFTRRFAADSLLTHSMPPPPPCLPPFDRLAISSVSNIRLRAQVQACSRLCSQTSHVPLPPPPSLPPSLPSFHRLAISSLTDTRLRAQVQGNLAALLLEAGHAFESLSEVEEALQVTADAGLMFNRAKALSTLGRVKEADQAYGQV